MELHEGRFREGGPTVLLNGLGMTISGGQHAREENVRLPYPRFECVLNTDTDMRDHDQWSSRGDTNSGPSARYRQ